jgi:hypothetical protein
MVFTEDSKYFFFDTITAYVYILKNGKYNASEVMNMGKKINIIGLVTITFLMTTTFFAQANEYPDGIDLQVPYTVNENTVFSASVVVHGGNNTTIPIPNATIYTGWYPYTVYHTDYNGTAWVLAPEVNQTRNYSIFATKDGYWDSEEIIVIDIPMHHNNSAPFVPSSPTPSNGAKNVNVYSSLSWVGGDPDQDHVTYSVFFGTTNPPEFRGNISNTTFNTGRILPGGHMQGQTKYFWQILSTDEHGVMTVGPVWCFTTAYAYEISTLSII